LESVFARRSLPGALGIRMRDDEVSSMVTGSEEQFIHLATCISRLHSALETLRAIKAASPDNPLIAPAFRFALVEYVSPYTGSDGQRGCPALR